MDTKELVELVTIEAALREHSASTRPILEEVRFRLQEIADELAVTQAKRAKVKAERDAELAAKDQAAKEAQARKLTDVNQPERKLPNQAELQARAEALARQDSQKVEVPQPRRA